jgi:hypothetical protein
MREERGGIDLLRKVVTEVADSLPPPRRQRTAMRPVVWGLATAAALVAVLVLGRFLLPRGAPSLQPRPPVEVLALRLGGRNARVRVIDSPAAGSIVVVAVPGATPGPRSEEGIR